MWCSLISCRDKYYELTKHEEADDADTDKGNVEKKQRTTKIQMCYTAITLKDLCPKWSSAKFFA